MDREEMHEQILRTSCTLCK